MVRSPVHLIRTEIDPISMFPRVKYLYQLKDIDFNRILLEEYSNNPIAPEHFRAAQTRLNATLLLSTVII